MIFLIQILIAWLLADFVTGIVHWLEDKYLDDTHSLNFLDSVSKDNDLHHKKPTAMLLQSYWGNMKSGAAVGWPLAAVLFWFDAPLWLWLFPFFAGFGNLVHRFAHTPKSQLPRWIRGLQEFGLFISHQHHDLHHRSMQQLIPKYLAGYKYCPMTDWVNPFLDRIGFWSHAESLLLRAGLPTVKQRRANL